MTASEAIEALKLGSAEEAAQAIDLSRGALLEDDELWHAVLNYFSWIVPGNVQGRFGFWFCQTLTSPERGSAGLISIFTDLAPCSQKSVYLQTLDEALRESRFQNKRRWFAAQGAILSDLTAGWSGQNPQVESYIALTTPWPPSLE